MNTPSAPDTTKPAESATTPVTTTKPALRKPVASERLLRHEFSDKEKLELGRELGDKLQEAAQIEADFTRVKGDFKAREAAVTASIGSLRDKVTSGYELRSTKCEWRFDEPKVGFKTLFRLDTDAAITTEPMTELEKQVPLPLETKPAEGPLVPPTVTTATEPPPVRPKTEERPKAARVGSGGVVGLPSDGQDLRDPDASKAVGN